MARKIPWIGTSWKMNKMRAEARRFAEALQASPVAQTKLAHPFVIPPFPYIAEVAQLLHGTSVRIGAQNMHWEDKGAWTGEVSPAMVKDCGATMVELGHSERRTFFNETDETVALKVKAALDHDLIALVCVGDTRIEYETGRNGRCAGEANALRLETCGQESAGAGARLPMNQSGRSARAAFLPIPILPMNSKANSSR